MGARSESGQRTTLICFAGDVWDGNPHSRHHLMRRLTGRYEVLFVEGVPMRSFATGDAFELRRALRKLRRGTSLRTVEDGLHVLRPWPIPPAGRFGRRAQAVMLRAQVLSALRRLRLTGPRITWFSVPTAAPLQGSLGEVGSLFYYQDRYEAFSHVDVQAIRAQVALLARRCDVTIGTSAGLVEDLKEMGAEAELIPHAVDLDRFSERLTPPEDVHDLERPLVGYVGIVDDYLDFDCFLAVADRLERGTVVVVGGANTDVSRLRHPRVRLLGRRPFEAIPAYLQTFSCCLVPFQINELTTRVNPIKLREYLAAGRPVVSTPMPEVLAYKPLISTAGDPKAFAEAVLAALAEGNDTESARARRRARVAGESWDRAADQIADALARIGGTPGR